MDDIMEEQDLCNYSKKEICTALRIIRDICANNNCSVCPFGYGADKCKIHNSSPCNFEIDDLEDTWKALR